MKPDRSERYFKSTETGNERFEGTTHKCVVIDSNPLKGDNPVVRISKGIEAPLIIVSNEKAEDWQRDEYMHVEILDAKETVMFGDRVPSKPDHTDDGDVVEESDDGYRVEFYIAGHKFTSEAFDTEERAESVIAFLSEHMDVELKLSEGSNEEGGSGD